MSGGAEVLVAMGVSGSGKTTLGKALAERLGWDFQEGDDLHPAANVEKMRSGQPLNDADRAPWLARIAAWIDEHLTAGRNGVITCSALKRAYRDQLGKGRPDVIFVFMDLDQAAIAERLKHRRGHYWPPSLLASQFADLQPPQPDEHVIDVDGTRPLEAQIEQVVQALAATG
jgi:carbohydrate kinase (thermoresistant glucokinase family)